MQMRRFRSSSAVLGMACSAVLALGNVARSQTAVTITSPAGARQTFQGLGTSQNNWGGEYQTLTQAQRTSLSQTLWRDLKFKVFRMWFNTNEYAPTRGSHVLTQMRTNYINSGMIADARANGVTTLLLAPDKLPSYMSDATNGSFIADAEIGNYATMLAEAIKQMKDEDGVIINATGIQNEPNNANNGPGMFTPAQIVTAVKALRVALDARGLQGVKIIASEAGSVDQSFFDNVDALKADATAWNSLAGIASHSYSMGATDGAANRIAAADGSNLKEYWMTEASDNGPEAFGMTGIPAMRATSLATRFLNDMNHRTTHWVHFVGLDVPDANDNATRIGYFTIPASNFSLTLFKKYYTYKQLSEAFDVGAVFRDSQSSLEGDMTWTYGQKPRITASTAKNPDGSWSIGVSNYTSNSFSGVQGQSDDAWNASQGGFTPAQNFSVTLKVDELRYTDPITFNVYRTDGTKLNQSEGTVTMVSGQVTLPVNSLDVVTLRSASVINYLPQPTPTPVPTGKIRYFPRSPYGSRMQYGTFQGSNGDPVNGPWTTLATIPTAATEGQWNEIAAPQTLSYRYLRYQSAALGNGNVAEIEFYSDGVKVTGTPFGSAAYANGSNTFAKAFDNDTTTFFDGNDSQAYTGIDRGTGVATPTPTPTATPTPTPIPPTPTPIPPTPTPVPPTPTPVPPTPTPVPPTPTPVPPTPVPPTPTPVPPTPTPGTGTGLTGQYYNGQNFGALVTTRTDPTVNFDWGTGEVMSGAPVDYFSARWTGRVQAVESGVYTFSVTSDDGERLWVNGVQLTNDWNGHAPTKTSGTITLTAGQKYDIKLEYFELQGGASVQLAWKRPGQTAEVVIPQAQMYLPSTVSPNAPTVSLTSPANGATFANGSTINLAATAADSDGTITKVDFYQGATLLNSDTTAPYAFSWAGAAPGSYSLSAKATDDGGNVTTSAAVNITVNAPANAAPSVGLTSPANGAVFTVGNTISLAANASDSDGTVSKVDFYQGATLLNSDPTAPFAYSWTNATAGSYSLTAKATDNSGAVTTSAAVNITVNAAGGGVSGSVTREVWTGVPGSTVADIPLGTTPNIVDTLTSLEGPSDWADSYGDRIKGFITAPTSGAYTFWIAGDDAGQFWLSTDSSAANKVQLCSFFQWVGSRAWNIYAVQKSAPVNLVAGQKYYFEILHKEGAGGDSIAVGWLKPGQSGTVPSEVVPSGVLSR